jgi:hypothetical protein
MIKAHPEREPWDTNTASSAANTMQLPKIDLVEGCRVGKHPRKAARLSRARVAVRGYDGFRFRRPPRLLALR